MKNPFYKGQIVALPRITAEGVQKSIESYGIIQRAINGHLLLKVHPNNSIYYIEVWNTDYVKRED